MSTLLENPEPSNINESTMTNDRKKRRPSEIDDEVDQGSNQRNTKVRFDPKVNSESFVANSVPGYSGPEYEEEAASELTTPVKVSPLKDHLLARAKPLLHQILAINCGTLRVAAAYSESQRRNLSILEDTQDSLTFDLISSCKSVRPINITFREPQFSHRSVRSVETDSSHGERSGP